MSAFDVQTRPGAHPAAVGSAPIEIASLSKTLGGTLVLDRVDIALAAGEFFALLGPQRVRQDHTD